MNRELIAGAIAEVMADVGLSLTDINKAIRERDEWMKTPTAKSDEYSHRIREIMRLATRTKP
jgi:hypothetical protein